MFKRTNHNEPVTSEDEIVFTWNGAFLPGREGDTLAAVLLAAGVNSNRIHPVTGEPRAPYCMMGVCFECLVEIDGIPNRQACQVRLRNGMRATTQHGVRI